MPLTSHEDEIASPFERQESTQQIELGRQQLQDEAFEALKLLSPRMKVQTEPDELTFHSIFEQIPSANEKRQMLPKQEVPRVNIGTVLVEVEEKPDRSEAVESGFQRPEAEELSKVAEQRMKDMQSVVKFVRENFDALDKDRDGVITDKEIAEKIIDPKFANGDNAVELIALRNVLDSWKRQIEDEKATGLTKDGLARIEEISKDKDVFRKGDRGVAVSQLGEVFFHLDSNKDGKVTPAEVEAALKRTDLKPEQRQALKDVQEYQNHLVTKAYKDAVKNDQGKLVVRVLGDQEEEIPVDKMGDLSADRFDDFLSDKERMAARTSDVFQHFKNRLESAKANPDQISQGTDGSCFFLAALASLKQLDPKAMDNMIKDNKNGTHTVTFPGKPDTPITVNTPTDAELAGWVNGSKAAILVKAFSEHYVKHMAPKELNEKQQAKLASPIPAERIVIGHSDKAMKLLTGKESAIFEIDMAKKNYEKVSDDELKKVLRDATVNGSPITADTYYRSEGIVGQHTYSVRFDEKTNEVILENPVKPAKQGTNRQSYPYEPFKIDGKAKDGKDDGVFRMSLADFKKHFTTINYVKK